MIAVAQSKPQVPEYDAHVFAAKSRAYALVIPVINEGTRIRDQISRIAALALPVDVVIADGGSTDGSLDAEFLRQSSVRALLVKTGPGKLSAQLRMAYCWALDQGYKGIITVDGNGKDDVAAIREFVDKLAAGYDYVQGSRYVAGGCAINTPLDRTIGNRLIHAPLLSIFGRHWYTDTTNGFRGYSAKYLQDARIAPFRDIFNKYELLFYLTLRAGQLGFRVTEVPVTRSYPKATKTPTKIAGMKGRFDMIGQLFSVIAGKYTPH